jgi:hypothetical protein
MWSIGIATGSSAGKRGNARRHPAHMTTMVVAARGLDRRWRFGAQHLIIGPCLPTRYVAAAEAAAVDKHPIGRWWQGFSVLHPCTIIVHQ